MTGFANRYEDKGHTLETELHRYAFSEDGPPVLSQIVRENATITLVQALGLENPDNTADLQPVYQDTVYGTKQRSDKDPLTRFKPLQSSTFEHLKQCYRDNITEEFGYGIPGKREYIIHTTDGSQTYLEGDNELEPTNHVNFFNRTGTPTRQYP